MEFLLGLSAAVVIFCAYQVGKIQGELKKPKRNNTNTPTEDEQRQKEQIKQYNEHFKALFNYDVSTALQRKKQI